MVGNLHVSLYVLMYCYACEFWYVCVLQKNLLHLSISYYNIATFHVRMYIKLNPIVHLWLHHTAHHTKKIIFVCRKGGIGGGGWGHLQDVMYVHGGC